MIRSMLHTCLISLHLLWIAGCSGFTTTEKAVVRDGGFDTDTSYERISSIVLVDGEEVRFDSDGAQVRHETHDLDGRTTSGEEIHMSWTTISGYRTTRPPTISLDESTNQRIGEIILVDGRQLVSFAGSGAIYNAARRTVTGQVGSARRTTSISADRILEARPMGIPLFDASPDRRPTSLAEAITTAPRASILFDDAGGTITTTSIPHIVGRTANGASVAIPFSDVLYGRIEVSDPLANVLASLGALLLVGLILVLIALATKQSCPFVYSFDGSTYVFDAEPLGGAISRGLAKTDYSRLEHLVDADGLYKLLVRNEVEETQMLDEMSLLVLDHEPGTTVVPTEQGQFYQVPEIVGPTSARDEHGRNLLPFVTARDGKFWQTHLPTTEADKQPGTRHTITLTFPKPARATEARFVFRGGTAHWGSNMIRSMLSLRGDGLPEWYAGVDRKGPEYGELVEFVVREELYVLKAYVKTGRGLDLIAYLPGGGPLVYEDRLVPIDLSQIPGDSLTIEIHPPYGFWGIDFLGLAYGSPAQLTPIELAAIEDASAPDPAVRSNLMATDGTYQTMPEVGDAFNLAFRAPGRVDGMERTLYLKTSGYYTLHIDTTKAEQTDLVRQLLRTPGMVVDYAMDSYIRYAASMSERTTAPAR